MEFEIALLIADRNGRVVEVSQVLFLHLNELQPDLFRLVLAVIADNNKVAHISFILVALDLGISILQKRRSIKLSSTPIS